MDKKALINSGRLQFPEQNRTDKNFIAKAKIDLQSFNPIQTRLFFASQDRGGGGGASEALHL